jgi:hypothetical protein
MNNKINVPFISNAKNKKYAVYVLDKNNKKKLINFGDNRYEQFKDKIGYYSNLDHNDNKRRENYLKRAKGIKNKQNELTYKLKYSPNYWSVNYLW